MAIINNIISRLLIRSIYHSNNMQYYFNVHSSVFSIDTIAKNNNLYSQKHTKYKFITNNENEISLSELTRPFQNLENGLGTSLHPRNNVAKLSFIDKKVILTILKDINDLDTYKTILLEYPL